MCCVEFCIECSRWLFHFVLLCCGANPTCNPANKFITLYVLNKCDNCIMVISFINVTIMSANNSKEGDENVAAIFRRVTFLMAQCSVPYVMVDVQVASPSPLSQLCNAKQVYYLWELQLDMFACNLGNWSQSTVSRSYSSTCYAIIIIIKHLFRAIHPG